MANRHTRIDALQIKDLSITDAQIATAAAIALSKLAATTPGYVVVGAATTGVPTYVAMSGDITIGNTGVTAIGGDKVLDSMIRLANAGNLRARNNADSADINILKVNASDLVELNATAWANAITGPMFRLANAVNLRARNNAGDGDINILNVNSSDLVALNATAWANAIAESSLAVSNGPSEGYYLKYVSGQMTWADIAAGYVEFADIIANEVPTGDVDGSNAAFVVANTPKTGTLQVYLNGLLQKPGSGKDYTLATATVTFTVAPESGDLILCNYVK
jgi:hypothetical protein